METKVHDFTIKTDTAPFLEAYQFSAVFFTRAKCLFNFSIASSTSLIALANSAGSRVSPQSGTGITSRFEPADDSLRSCDRTSDRQPRQLLSRTCGTGVYTLLADTGTN